MPIKNLQKRIIIFKGSFDSLIFFAESLSRSFRELGYTVLLTDTRDTETVLEEIYRFAIPGNTVAVFFNHGGLSLLNKQGDILWNELDVDCYNWIVDHPMYYHEPIIFPIKKCTFLCVDQYHQKFIERFYQGRRKSYFLPLAGCSLSEDILPFKERSIEIVFTGAYLIDNSIELHTQDLPEGLARLWKDCYNLLMQNMTLTLEQAVEHCYARIGIQLSEEDWRDAVRLFKDIDGMLRSGIRAKVVKTLVDHDIKVSVFGEGWEYLECRQENLIVHPRVSFEESVKIISNAKIVLNVMPWFKAGVHDRVYTAMINKSVSLTDSSVYMDKTLKNGQNVIFYSINELQKLPQLLTEYMGKEHSLMNIAEQGFQFAHQNESFLCRAKSIRDIFEGTN